MFFCTFIGNTRRGGQRTTLQKLCQWCALVNFQSKHCCYRNTGTLRSPLYVVKKQDELDDGHIGHCHEQRRLLHKARLREGTYIYTNVMKFCEAASSGPQR